MSPRLDEFTTEQIKFALASIKSSLNTIEELSDLNEIHKGNCKPWEALAVWKAQLTIALERREKVDKTWSN